MASELAPVTGLSVIKLGASLAPNWMSTLLVLALSVLRFSAWLTCDCMLLRLEVPPAFAEEHAILTTSWPNFLRSEEHTSELQSRGHLVCRLLLEKKKQPKCSQGLEPPHALQH